MDLQRDRKGHGDGDERDPETELRDGSLSLDAILSVLSNPRRRDLLSYLGGIPDGTATVDECVDRLVARTAERTGERSGRDSEETALRHVHLPKLTDAGVLEYDARRREVRYRGHDRLEHWLEQTRAAESVSPKPSRPDE